MTSAKATSDAPATADSDDIFFMTNLSPRMTGLPMAVWASPRGKILQEGKRSEDDVVMADLDLDQIREVRNVWQFFRDRRPETYEAITAL